MQAVSVVLRGDAWSHQFSETKAGCKRAQNDCLKRRTGVESCFGELGRRTWLAGNGRISQMRVRSCQLREE